ncbi:ABC-F family ATP-binding cassette domain-containing protein, partial [Candidatus Dependentiae bacterium]
MIELKNISLTLGNKELFRNFSMLLSKKRRIGVVGRNGSGKSTLLKLVTGLLTPDSGSIETKKGQTIAYVPQEMVFETTKTIFQEAMMAFEDQIHSKEALDGLIEKYESQHTSSSDELAEQIHTLSEKIKDTNFNQLEKKAQQALFGLGFDEKQMNQPASTLSAGWKMRLLLAKLLLQNADFYLFDEPTNHLDIVARDWFLDFVQKSNFGFLLVSHDRYFLDHACSHILDLDQKPPKLYVGTYANFLEKRKHDLEILKAAVVNQERMIKAKLATAERFRAKSSKAKMAQSIFKEVEKIEKIELPQETSSIKIKFKDIPRSGKITLETKNLSKS